MRLGFTGLFAGLFLLTSCTPKQADQVISSADSQAIIGGGYIEASDPIAHSTVQLIRFEDGRSRTGPRTSCSASIISDTIILTAAHCMDHAYKSTADVSGLWVYFSNKVPSIDDVLPDNLLRKAVNGVVHPEWGDAIEKVNAGLNNINDIGILSFSGGLPQSFVPAKLVESTTVLVAHQKVTGAGFGYVSIWPQEQAQKYKYEPDNFLKTSQLKWATFEITDPNFAEREFSANDPNKRQFVCMGDSGGPMYVQDSSGQLLLVGIIVRGTLIIKEFKEIMCGENIYQIFTKISAYLDWISSESKKLNDELSGS